MRQKVFYQAAPLFFLLSWQGYAASAFTCTTFTEGEASKYLIGLTTSSFNNGGDITGTTFDFASTNYDPFFVDETGAAIPFTMPPGTAFRINNFLVNNAGTLAAGTIAGGVYFIKADGSYTLIDPPPAPYSVAWINGFNNNEELTGVLQSKSASGPEAYVGFFRGTDGNYNMLDAIPVPPSYPELGFPGGLTDTGVILENNGLRTLKGPFTPLVFRGALPSNAAIPTSFNGLNNQNQIAGDLMGHYSFLQSQNGDAPAIVCGNDLSLMPNLIAGAVNDKGIVTGSVGQTSSTTGTFFVATPTGVNPTVQLSNQSWTFASHPVGQRSGSGTIYLTNTGKADLHIVSLGIGARDKDDNPRDFSIGDSTCFGAGPVTTLAPNQFCATTFYFTPLGHGLRSAQLVIESDAADAPNIIRVQGVGIGPLVLSNTSWTFAAHPVGQTSGPGVIYVYNQSPETIGLTNFGITGANSSDFAILQSTCGSGFLAYKTCSITFDFRPSAKGQRNAVLGWTSMIEPGTATPQVVPLAGSGY